ncbi:Phosphoglycolate phosphatase [Paramagnetospirillum magnetotacticum MS-1]|uniref:Phosphoglycolate phosphatase n=1 Tax=Paramagnetospirillum magnetotacticum MS-1 TaxID=272627 RepID=A0A0C2UEB8_PARME|nr:phosphoglycolate phosphatase [Paramagnetospirillum magnetotacticum]KIL99847.1 Phosphoglycolate phosphatase [Paramagnetospirillum magnetotacticum MS-1]
MGMGLLAVLFDLDGTLIHSLPDLVAAVNRLLESESRQPLDDRTVMSFVGDGAGTLVSRAFKATGGMPGPEVGPYLERFLADYEPRSAESTRPWPGVPETLARLKEAGLKLAVCTNKPSRATDEILAALDLERWFDLVVGADDAPAIKPDPAHVTCILDRLGVPAARAVMVGDSANDILSARAAGVRSVALSFGYCHGPVAELGADWVIDDFRELSHLLLG